MKLHSKLREISRVYSQEQNYCVNYSFWEFNHLIIRCENINYELISENHRELRDLKLLEFLLYRPEPDLFFIL